MVRETGGYVMKKLRIGMIASNHKIFPSSPDSIWAPGMNTNRIVEGLIRRGHDVTLFAAKGSKTSAKLIHEDLPSVHEQFKDKVVSDLGFYNIQFINYALMLISKACEMANAGKFDILHGHDYRLLSYFSNLISLPLILTYRGNINDDSANLVDKKRFKRFYHSLNCVAISNYQRKISSNYLNFVATIHNSINANDFEYNSAGGDHLLYMGRIIEKKGPDIAIRIAKKAKMKLLIAGDPGRTPEELHYWKDLQKQIDGKQIKYVGHIPFNKVDEAYGKAKALIFPLRWHEPFGMVIIESMACGTPVIAFGRGAAPEVIKDGKTGFVVKPDDMDGMIKAIQKIDQVKREDCREHVKKKFSIEPMIDKYEKVYEKILKQWKKK